MSESEKKPGWYKNPEDESSYEAYWDGERWTGDTRPTKQRRWITTSRSGRILLRVVGIAGILLTIWMWMNGSDFANIWMGFVVGLVALVIPGWSDAFANARQQEIPAKEVEENPEPEDRWAYWLGDWAVRDDEWRFQFPAQYRGGLAGTQPTRRQNIWLVQMIPRGLSIGEGVVEGLIGKAANLPTGGVAHWRSSPWDEVEFVHFEDTNQERINKGAVALFGVFAIGAKIPQSGIHVRYKDGAEIFLVVDGTVFDWRAQMSTFPVEKETLTRVFQYK